MVRFDFSGAVALFETATTVAVCGHKNPDGDCLGSVLALTHALRAKGVQVTPLLATGAKPANLDLLAGYDELVPAADYKKDPDVFVMVDVPSDERMTDGAQVKARAKATVKIDHHAGDDDVADICYIDPSAAAAGVMVWDLIGQMGVKRTAQIAQCCYVALMTDTGSFRYQNADASAFALAAEMVAAGAEPATAATQLYQRKTMAAVQLEARVAERMRFACDGHLVISWMDEHDLEEIGATKDDCEELTDVVRQIAGPEVSVILRGMDGHIRGSIRSKTDHNVRVIAEKMNGGGHVAASGFTLHCPMDEALETVIANVADSFGITQESEDAR